MCLFRVLEEQDTPPRSGWFWSRPVDFGVGSQRGTLLFSLMAPSRLGSSLSVIPRSEKDFGVGLFVGNDLFFCRLRFHSPVVGRFRRAQSLPFSSVSVLRPVTYRRNLSSESLGVSPDVFGGPKVVLYYLLHPRVVTWDLRTISIDSCRPDPVPTLSTPTNV